MLRDFANGCAPAPSCRMKRPSTRVGGSFRILMKSKTGEYEHTGVYKVVDPPSKLVFTWTAKATGDTPTLVTVEFFAAGEETEIVLTHEKFTDPEVGKRYRGGWGQILEKLAIYQAKKVQQ